MHVVEIFESLSPGGAESALINRLRHTPPEVSSTILTLGTVDPVVERSMAMTGADLVYCRGFGEVRRALGRIHPHKRVYALAHTPVIAMRLLSERRPSHSLRRVVVAHSTRLSDSPIKARVLAPGIRALNSRADLHIAVSEAVSRGAWCCGARKVVVVPLGSTVATSESPRPSWPADTRKRLLMVGRLVRNKNVDLVLRALGNATSTLKSEGAHLLICGDGPQRKQLEATARRLELSNLVTFCGHFDGASSLMQEADVLIIASAFEGGPLTAYEASLAGTPIISTPVGSVPEVIGHDSRSRLIRHKGLEEELVSSMVEILYAPPLSAAERRERAYKATKWHVELCSVNFYKALAELA